MLVFFTALAMAASAPSADLSNPDGKSHVKFIYYDIKGNSISELENAIYKLGPGDPDTNERYAGFTKWNVTWTYTARSRGGACKVTRLKVKATSRVTLPRWTPSEDASEELKTKWNIFVAALEKHELKHVNFSIRLSDEIKASSSELVSSVGCEDLRAKFQENFDRLSKYFMRLDKEFDIRTDHGKTEGANLD